jgi:hypothetical protein
LRKLLKKSIMKKILLLTAVVMLSMASCKKEYTCECTATVSGTGIPTTTTSASSTIKDTKSKATDACEAGNKSAATSGAFTSETKCVIK